ncbi:hypothetical protein INR49_019096 [Caranx melampygus]|nr:hypothetical protein INR49_019096 [Caranx melampygus]
MTIRTVRPDRVQHFRHECTASNKVAGGIVVEMQDPKGGVKGSEQNSMSLQSHMLHCISALLCFHTGQDIIAWIANKMKTEAEEAHVFGTMLVAYGYIYPLQNHKKLVICNDTSLYRFQTPYFWPKQNWVADDTDYGGYDTETSRNIFFQQAIMRSKVKSSVSLGAVDVPTKMRVERWSFSLFELLSDLRGRDDFKVFLKKEFSGENLAFWEAAEELKWGTASSMSAKAETIFKTFLAPGAPRWINIDGRTMGLTVKGLDHPHRYVLEAAQTHVFLLMKKDTFFRYLKSPVYKDIQKKALNPQAHDFSPAQLEQNAKNRSLGIHPIILFQQEEEEKAKAAAASAPVDVKAMMSKIDRKK